jgi:hypothetical protein
MTGNTIRKARDPRPAVAGFSFTPVGCRRARIVAPSKIGIDDQGTFHDWTDLPQESGLLGRCGGDEFHSPKDGKQAQPYQDGYSSVFCWPQRGTGGLCSASDTSVLWRSAAGASRASPGNTDAPKTSHATRGLRRCVDGDPPLDRKPALLRGADDEQQGSRTGFSKSFDVGLRTDRAPT